jgi:anti-sigma factor RsiW
MNMLNNKEPERFDIEALLPWHAAGTLSRRDADRVEQALASDRELQRRYALVREEFAETIHLNESLGAPSSRAMEKLFAAIDAEEARAPRRRASFDLTGRISEFLSSFTPRTLAWSATAAAVAIVVQAAVITAVVVKDRDAPSTYGVANKSQHVDGSYVVVSFVPQATVAEITKFLGAYKATVVEAPTRTPLGGYRIKLSETKLKDDEVTRIIKQMQNESKIVSFIALQP